MKKWITRQNSSVMASHILCLVAWVLGYLTQQSVLRFLAILFLVHGLIILFLDWYKSLNGEPEVGEILILDREDGKRTAQEVAFSSMLVYDSLVEILERKGVATRREVERRMEDIKQDYIKSTVHDDN